MTKAEYQESNLGCFQKFHTFKIDIKKMNYLAVFLDAFPFPVDLVDALMISSYEDEA